MADKNEKKPEYPNHNPNNQLRAENVFGMFRTVDAVPAFVPTNWFDQVVLYVSASAVDLYFYDVKNKLWRVIWTGNFVGSGLTNVTQAATQITISSSAPPPGP